MTDDQLDLFRAAREGRDEGMKRVYDHADPEWKRLALEAVKRTCEQLDDFISDDVWTVGQCPESNKARALGPIIKQASVLGWAVKTDRVRPSVRSHLSGKPVWKSLLYREDAA